MSKAGDIANAVVAAINAEDFAWARTAVRHYRLKFDLRDLPDAADPMLVTVQPGGFVEDGAARGPVAQGDYVVLVEIAGRVDKQDGPDAAIDARVGRLEAIGAALRAIGTFDGAEMLTFDASDAFDREAYDEQGAFYGRAVVTFRDFIN